MTGSPGFRAAPYYCRYGRPVAVARQPIAQGSGQRFLLSLFGQFDGLLGGGRGVVEAAHFGVGRGQHLEHFRQLAARKARWPVGPARLPGRRRAARPPDWSRGSRPGISAPAGPWHRRQTAFRYSAAALSSWCCASKMAPRLSCAGTKLGRNLIAWPNWCMASPICPFCPFCSSAIPRLLCPCTKLGLIANAARNSPIASSGCLWSLNRLARSL